MTTGYPGKWKFCTSQDLRSTQSSLGTASTSPVFQICGCVWKWGIAVYPWNSHLMVKWWLTKGMPRFKSEKVGCKEMSKVVKPDSMISQHLLSTAFSMAVCLKKRQPFSHSPAGWGWISSLNKTAIFGCENRPDSSELPCETHPTCWMLSVSVKVTSKSSWRNLGRWNTVKQLADQQCRGSENWVPQGW